MSLLKQSRGKQPERILLLLPCDYLFYFNHGLALRQALLRQGVDCLALIDGMNQDSMLSVLSEFQQQIVMSIYSTKNEVLERYPEITHIRWVQDNQFDTADYSPLNAAPESGICYLETTRFMNMLPVKAKHLAGTLRFAATPTQAGNAKDMVSTFSLIGFTPDTNILNTIFEISPTHKVSGWDYLVFLKAVQQNSLDTSLELLDQIVEVS